jgi:hypothetical protein
LTFGGDITELLESDYESTLAQRHPDRRRLHPNAQHRPYGRTRHSGRKLATGEFTESPDKSNYRQSWNGVYQEESLTVSGRPVAPGPELARSVARNRSESVDCRFTRDAFRLSRGRVRNQDDGVRDPSAYGPVVMAVCTK